VFDIVNTPFIRPFDSHGNEVILFLLLEICHHFYPTLDILKFICFFRGDGNLQQESTGVVNALNLRARQHHTYKRHKHNVHRHIPAQMGLPVTEY
jgi:hypothetical protein